MEHFCTLFDANFLPAGLCLHESLEAHAGRYHLWILCIDEKVEAQLAKLALPHVTFIPLRELETAELLRVKTGRSRAEYCWTLTPFLPAFVLKKDPGMERITYLDADLFFFSDPALLLGELGEAHALITDHAYDPRYDQSATSGKFCVQFLTFRNTPKAQEIITWWQDRCLEWCFARHEDGKFGDQKYLEQWPGLFGSAVKVVEQTSLTLAPWNVAHFLATRNGGFSPVFFHFHGLRLNSPTSARLFSGYEVGPRATNLYDSYVGALSRAVLRIEKLGETTPFFPEAGGLRAAFRNFRYLLSGRTRVAWFR